MIIHLLCFIAGTLCGFLLAAIFTAGKVADLYSDMDDLRIEAAKHAAQANPDAADPRRKALDYGEE